MKKHLTQLLLSLLFLVVTAMTCDEQDLAEPIDISCILKEVELYHWDNAGEKPKEALDNKILNSHTPVCLPSLCIPPEDFR